MILLNDNDLSIGFPISDFIDWSQPALCIAFYYNQVKDDFSIELR